MTSDWGTWVCWRYQPPGGAWSTSGIIADLWTLVHPEEMELQTVDIGPSHPYWASFPNFVLTRITLKTSRIVQAGVRNLSYGCLSGFPASTANILLTSAMAHLVNVIITNRPELQWISNHWTAACTSTSFCMNKKKYPTSILIAT